MIVANLNDTISFIFERTAILESSAFRQHMQWLVINMLMPCIRASRSMLDHFFIINACLSQCGRSSHCLAFSACVQAALITFDKLNATPPYGCNCYLVNCLPLPKSQALGDPSLPQQQFFSILSFLTASQSTQGPLYNFYWFACIHNRSHLQTITGVPGQL